MWKVKQLILILLAWVLLLVAFFSTNNFGHITDPPDNPQQEFQQQTNNSKEIFHQTPTIESEQEIMSQIYLNENEAEIGHRMKERRERVKAVCKEHQLYNNVMNTIIYRDFFFHNYSTTVCLIAKVGIFSFVFKNNFVVFLQLKVYKLCYCF